MKQNINGDEKVTKIHNNNGKQQVQKTHNGKDAVFFCLGEEVQ